MNNRCLGSLVTILEASQHTLFSRLHLHISPEFLLFCLSLPLSDWFDCSSSGPLEFMAGAGTTWKVSFSPLFYSSPLSILLCLTPAPAFLFHESSLSSRRCSEGQLGMQQIRRVCWGRKCWGKVCFLSFCHLLCNGSLEHQLACQNCCCVPYSETGVLNIS